MGVIIAMLCGYACYWSARWTAADYAVRSSIALALRLAPRNPDYYVRLAQAEPALALSALQRATQLNPLSSSVWIDLAGAAEEHHDLPMAERCLLRAVELDKTFAPRWLLAEYYSRRRDQARFWPAMRAALATSYDDVTPLFDTCWDLAPDPAVIRNRALPERPDVWRQYFDFLLAKDRLDAADEIANQIMKHAGPDTVPSLLRYCDRLLENNQGSRAMETWNRLAAKHLLDYPALAPDRGVSLTNGALAKEFLSQAFDWRAPPSGGVFLRHDTSPPGLRFDFSGQQSEHTELLNQFVPVAPARQYRLAMRYETEGLEGDAGLAWHVVDPRNNADLLRGDGRITASERRERAGLYAFDTPPDTSLLKLVLAYDRVLGTVRINGSLWLTSTALDFRQ